MSEASSENPRHQAVLDRARQACVEAGFPDTTTPFVDGWMTLNKGIDTVKASVTMPVGLWVDLADWGRNRDRANCMASVNIGGLTFTHQVDDMRMLLLAALEWLDRRDAEWVAEPCTNGDTP